MTVEGDRRLSEYPMTLAELGVQVQLKSVPATSEERLIFVGEFEQIDFARGDVIK